MNGKNGKPNKNNKNKKNSFSPRNRKPIGKNEFMTPSQKVKEDLAAEGRRPYNSPAWYTRNPAAAEAATKIINNYVAGGRTFEFFTHGTDEMRRCAVPGIMNVAIKHVVGGTVTAESAIDLAAKHKYTEIRLKNTGSQVYEANDLMMYFLAMDGIYSAYAFMKRIYATLSLFDTMNWYYPNGLLASLGMSDSAIADFRANYANFYAWLILMADQINTINVPKDIDLYARHEELYSSVFLDAPNVKAGLIQFVPTKVAFDCWYENPDPTMYRGNFTLRPVKMPLTSFADMKTYFEGMLMSIIRSEDFFSTMNSDMIKVYGVEGCKRVAPPQMGEKLVMTYSEEILSQIQNAIVVQISDTQVFESFIAQDVASNRIIQSVHFQKGLGDFTPILNFHSANPSTDEILTGTRLTAVMKDGDDVAEILASGTEVVTALKIVSLRYADDGSVGYVQNNVYSIMNGDGGVNSVLYTARLSVFNHHPIIYMTKENENTNTNEVFAFYGDVDDYMIASPSTLKGLHDVCIYSLFNVFSNKY